MCDCCKKIIVETVNNINTSSIDFISIEDVTVESLIPYQFNYTAPSDGDYILQLELSIVDYVGTGTTSLTSTLTKNNIAQTNTNDLHRLNLDVRDTEITYTHNCKITGVVAGDNIGFLLNAIATHIYNGSITVLKI